MVQSFTEDFQVVWKDPADAELHWSWDKLHSPRPSPPLAIDLSEGVFAAIFSARYIALNGYAYSNGWTVPGPTPEVLERGAFEVWENEYIPRIRDFCSRLRTEDYDRMSAVQLADSLDGIIDGARDSFRYTFVVVMGFFLPTNPPISATKS